MLGAYLSLRLLRPWILFLFSCIFMIFGILFDFYYNIKKVFESEIEYFFFLYDHIGWAISMPFASIYPTHPRTNPWNFCEKISFLSFLLSIFEINWPLGVVHKLRWRNFGFSWPPCVDIFYGINVDKKWTFLDHLPTSSCKRSLWTAP